MEQRKKIKFNMIFQWLLVFWCLPFVLLWRRGRTSKIPSFDIVFTEFEVHIWSFRLFLFCGIIIVSVCCIGCVYGLTVLHIRWHAPHQRINGPILCDGACRCVHKYSNAKWKAWIVIFHVLKFVEIALQTIKQHRQRRRQTQNNLNPSINCYRTLLSHFIMPCK